MKNYPIQANKTSTLRSQVLALRISSANVTKSVGNWGFTEEILNGKAHFLCSVSSILMKCVFQLRRYKIAQKLIEVSSRIQSGSGSLGHCSKGEMCV